MWPVQLSLFLGAAGPATHCLVVLRRGALADWAQISIGLIRPHCLLNQSWGWGRDPGAGGRVESPASHMAENEGGTISWREFEILFPGARRICGGQQMQMCATGHGFPWCSSLPPLPSVVMSLFLLLFTPAESSLLCWSSRCPNQAQAALGRNDSLSN